MTILTSRFVRWAARQRRPPGVWFTACLIGILTACASARVTPLMGAAAHVEKITAEQALACAYLNNVEFVAKLTGMGKSYEMVHQAGENGLRTMIAHIGGNAYVDTRMDADGWGRIDYSGQAFHCSPQVTASFGFTGQSWH